MAYAWHWSRLYAGHSTPNSSHQTDLALYSHSGTGGLPHTVVTKLNTQLSKMSLHTVLLTLTFPGNN